MAKIPLDKMPDWPGRMTAPVAAAYMGVSHTTFLDRFRGTGVKEGGKVFWARALLDAMIAKQFGLETAVPSRVTPALSDYDLWRAEQDREIGKNPTARELSRRRPPRQPTLEEVQASMRRARGMTSPRGRGK